MLSSAVLISEDDKRVSKNKNVEAARCRVNNGDQVLMFRWAVNALSDHPRWMFKKNSIEFFIGLDYYLYYFYSSCTLSL